MKDHFAESYKNLEEWHWWFRGRERILETVLQQALEGRRPESIASLGSGPAEGLRWLLPFVGPKGRVVGVDLNPLHARPPDSSGASAFCVVGSVEAVPIATGLFDVVLALDVLEHLDDDVAGLNEAVRLLKPDGLLLVTVPAMPSLWGTQDEVSHHRRRYTKRTLSRVFSTARLPVPDVSYFNSLLFPPVAAIRWARRSLGKVKDTGSDFDGNRPGVVNDVLEKVFGFERHLIHRVPMPVGVSLLATMRRTA